MRWMLAALALAACAHTPAPNFSIGADGAAGLNARTEGTQAAIARAAPGFDVAADEIVSGARRFPRFTLSHAGEIVFSAYPSADGARLTGVGTRSPLARGAHNDVIGQGLFADAAGVAREHCRLAMPHERFSFSCPDESGQFWRAYQAPAGYIPGASFDESPAEIVDASVLAQMYWTAPSAAE